MTITEHKAQLRKEMLALRREIPPGEARTEAEAVTRHVLAWPLYQQARCVMLYASMPEELSTRALCQAVLSSEKVLLLPRLEGRHVMSARLTESLGALVPGPMGILEPAPDAPVCPPEAIDLVLCPGLAFDIQGWRLGFGAGYYDSFLAQSPALRAGLCYLRQQVPQVPHDARDVPMHHLITARGIIPRQEEAPTA